MKRGDPVKICDPLPGGGRLKNGGKIGTVLHEVLPRLPGGPTRFSILCGGEIEEYAIYLLEPL